MLETYYFSNIRTELDSSGQRAGQGYGSRRSEFRQLSGEDVRCLVQRSANKIRSLDPIPITLLVYCLEGTEEELLPVTTCSFEFISLIGSRSVQMKRSSPVRGRILPMTTYTGRLSPKGVPFSGFRYMKG